MKFLLLLALLGLGWAMDRDYAGQNVGYAPPAVLAAP